jgi:hypothetical protein
MKPVASECRLFGPKCIKTHLRASTDPKNFFKGSLSLAMKGAKERGGQGTEEEGGRRGGEGKGGEGRSPNFFPVVAPLFSSYTIYPTLHTHGPATSQANRFGPRCIISNLSVRFNPIYYNLLPICSRQVETTHRKIYDTS